MNRINFTAQDNFPLSSDTMDILQQMVHLCANMASLGGSNYILSGCTDNGETVSSGTIVINGELLIFEGGDKKDKISIVQTTRTLTAFGISFPEAYIFRIAKFSDTGEYNWADFRPASTNYQLQQLISSIRGDAPGTIKMWSGQIVRIPTDYRLCDGSLLSVSEYPGLFENVGTTFGGNGVDSFALPDLRGRFIVGYDTSNTDYNVIGKTGGTKEVTLTKAQLPEHNHRDPGDGVFNRLSARAADIDATNTPGSTDQTGAEREYRVAGMTDGQWEQARIKAVGENQPHENRPPYVVLAYIIKVR